MGWNDRREAWQAQPDDARDGAATDYTFGWLSHWGGLLRERAGRLDVATGRLTCVVCLMAANALNNPA